MHGFDDRHRRRSTFEAPLKGADYEIYDAHESVREVLGHLPVELVDGWCYMEWELAAELGRRMDVSDERLCGAMGPDLPVFCRIAPDAPEVPRVAPLVPSGRAATVAAAEVLGTYVALLGELADALEGIPAGSLPEGARDQCVGCYRELVLKASERTLFEAVAVGRQRLAASGGDILEDRSLGLDPAAES
ncbi:hypothetical protein [Caniella muris]|uniref:hypothetical protein n=1 Tax=Caniella muris TaxID=2941502 RepID=UPI00203F61C0|nr:hypothetical protein [Caniella muris]